MKPWSKFDFVPGDVILFEDLLENEENGEFPSKWDIYSGNVENAIFNGEKIINYQDNAAIVPLIDKLNVPTIIVPMVNMDNNQHSPNENIRIGNMRQGIKICLSILNIKL